MRTLVLLSLALLAISNTAIAAEKGDMLLRVGPYGVSPKSNNHPALEVDDGASLGFNFTYFVSEKLAIEVLAALPFSHDIKDKESSTKLAEAKHLPPTVSLQYHFNTDSAFSPYAGLGVNITTFTDVKETSALEGSEVDLETSAGLAAQLGVDISLNEDWVVNLDLRYIDIETDANVFTPGDPLGSGPINDIEISPFVYGLTIGRRF